MKKVLSIFISVVMILSMSISIFAMEFTASIEVKPSPELVVDKDEDGNEYVATIVKEKDGEVVDYVPLKDTEELGTTLEFLLISAAEKESAPIQEIKENLTVAENLLKELTVENISPELKAAIDQKIDQFFAGSTNKITFEDLIVQEVYSANLIRDSIILEQVEDGERCIFKIKTKLTKEDFFLLLQLDGDAWSIVEGIEWSEDGYLIISVDQLSVFALLIARKSAPPVKPDGPNSPQTDVGLGIKIEYAIIAAVFVGITTFFVVKSRKKRSN